MQLSAITGVAVPIVTQKSALKAISSHNPIGDSAS
jgi:hypothetical protein